jgi:hypothetical protein
VKPKLAPYLGYYIGYKIREAFYQKESDKAAIV